MLKFQPEDGMHVVARGRLSVYEVKGEYQLVCDALEPHGLGALQAAFEQLKRRLQAEGLFDAARKRPLPVLPRRIGVVTSLDGAARARHPARAHDAASRPRASSCAPRACRARARRDDLVRALARDRARAGGRRRHHRPRRRIGRGSLGVQRRGAGARDRRLSGAGDLGGRPRSGLHDRRLRRRRPRGHAVERRRARRRSRRQLLRAHRPRRRSGCSRAHRRARRPARASAPTGWRAARASGRSRVVMRERDRAGARPAARRTRSRGARRAGARQRFDALRRRLERRDVRRVAAELRTRLVARRRAAARRSIARAGGWPRTRASATLAGAARRAQSAGRARPRLRRLLERRADEYHSVGRARCSPATACA